MTRVARLALLPARGGSKRVPHKNIAPLLGRPALHYPLASAASSGLFDEIHVSTDSAEVRAVAASAGFEPRFDRPRELASDATPILAVAKWVVDRYRRQAIHFDTVVTIHPTAVLLEPAHLIEGVRRFEVGHAPVLAVVPAPAPLEKAMLLGDDARLEPVEPRSFGVRSQHGRRLFFDAGSFFVADPSQIEGAGTTLTGMVGYELPQYAGVDIDDPDDLEHARRLLAGRQALLEGETGPDG